MITTVNGYRIAPQADLHKADLIGADLRKADLRGADLRGADLYKADLYKADLREATLSEASLIGADLRGANFIGASLKNTNLFGTALNYAQGIFSFGPIGLHSRIGYAVATLNDGVNIQLGCFWGSLEEACSAIQAEYGHGSLYEETVRFAARIVLTNY